MNDPAHRTHVLLGAQAKHPLAGRRSVAVPVRDQTDTALSPGGDMVLDFAGNAVAQSSVEELLGSLILCHGPEILQRIVFT
jgi:hypothetical protein